jgi:hypothetical protein
VKYYLTSTRSLTDLSTRYHIKLHVIWKLSPIFLVLVSIEGFLKYSLRMVSVALIDILSTKVCEFVSCWIKTENLRPSVSYLSTLSHSGDDCGEYTSHRRRLCRVHLTAGDKLTNLSTENVNQGYRDHPEWIFKKPFNWDQNQENWGQLSWVCLLLWGVLGTIVSCVRCTRHNRLLNVIKLIDN